MLSLNEEQATALRHAARMVSREADNDVLLVHGVFGSGKTTFLAILLLYLVDLFESSTFGMGVRFLSCYLFLSS